MRYQFNVTPAAQGSLAELWLLADSKGRSDIVWAMDLIERELHDDPHVKSEIVFLSSNVHMIARGALTVYFIINEDDRRVDVVSVERRPDPSQNGKPSHGKVV